MTITVPTGELVGILADVIPFACPDPELPDINTVRLEWDGDMLTATATDQIRIAMSSWQPDDQPDDDTQDDLFTKFGSDGDPAWSATILLADAKDIVKAFKLPPKEQRVPLTVDITATGGQVTIKRGRDTGYTEHIITVESVDGTYPDVRQVLAKHDAVTPVKEVAFTAKLLADFSKVRPRGPLEFGFTGPESLVHVTIGSRFVGAIMAVRRGADNERMAA